MHKNILSRSLATAFLFGLTARMNAQELVVRIDDMGCSHSANVASIDTYRNGIAGSVEVMPVCAWFPEAVRMLRENPGLDVGVHLTLTSEWENVKWRPLTHCPSLVDKDGNFYPMMNAHKAYPGQSVKENLSGLKLAEVEQEFRAQIELALRHIPQVTHLTGHMGATGFTPEVNELVKRLAAEYGLSSIDRAGSAEDYSFQYVGYDGPHGTLEEKKASFIGTLKKMEKGRRYLFLDHPAYDDAEMSTVFHVGYENVAADRQGVTDLLKSEEVKNVIRERGIKLIDINALTKQLPRQEATKKLAKAADKYIEAVVQAKQDLHSIMVVKDGKVVFEKWMGSGKENEPHVLNSVSKTFTSAAVGLAISEGKLSLTDKVISFFPDKLPAQVGEHLSALTIRHLLTMNTGHEKDPSKLRNTEKDWEKAFLHTEFPRQPGTIFCYNSLATYMLSAIVQKVTGQKLVDYLYPRLFRPLGINNVRWQESPTGVNAGGWGLFLKTEDLAKMGLLLLQGGQWQGKQVLPADWVKEMSSAQVPCVPAGRNSDALPQLMKNVKKSDWLQGYGYQMWRCRHNAFRADGAAGQYIIVIPEKNAVVATTANIGNMQAEIDLIWKYLLPAL
jgi:CubicO group peptidase (beta-lactamase class C family)